MDRGRTFAPIGNRLVGVLTSLACIATAILGPTVVSLAEAPNSAASPKVIPEAIWFQSELALERWQAVRNSASVETIVTYRDSVLRSREGWQLFKPLRIEVCHRDAARSLAEVSVITAGRLEGTRWFVDARDLDR